MKKALGYEDGTPSTVILERRIGHFLVDPERGKKIRLRFGGREYGVGESKAAGHFHGSLRIPTNVVKGVRKSNRAWTTCEEMTTRDDPRRFFGRVNWSDPEGLSVISDIDDTIKVSQVRDRTALLKNTFENPFMAVPGMADLYQRLSEGGASFHYVSGSPWPLYMPLSEILETQRFPRGTVHLKYFRLTDQTLFRLFESQEK